MPPAVPIATYRLQLGAAFGFDATAELVPYLKALGISHIYASPFLKARSGSSHGYDIVDHAALNPEFGGDAAFERLAAALRQADIGLILDFVPNHMGVGHADNAWWLDVLEWGRKSPHASAFDISWDLLPFRRGGGVLVPALGRPYGEALHGGEIELRFDPADGTLSAWYFDHRFPIHPPRYAEVIKRVVAAADADETNAGRALLALAADHSAVDAPPYAGAAAFKSRLAGIEGAAGVFERGLAAYRAESEAGIGALHRLLERQNYRLAYWRVAVSSINYRRFFDINDLAGVRVEHLPTFRAVHGLVARMAAAGTLHGLRLDHIDGLRDPVQYARRLSELLRRTAGATHRQPFYVVAEKILDGGEPMPKLPGIAGTTGYEWLNVISQVLVDRGGLDRLDATWRAFTGERRPFPEMVEDAKRRVLDTMLTSEFTVLTELLARIAAGHYSTRDFAIDRLRAALELYIVEFPIYRTYVTAAGASVDDRAVIDRTVDRARARWHGQDRDIFDFLRDVLTLDLIRDRRTYSPPRIRDFNMKLQQFTGPMMAKSLEDTAFYRHHRLIALNEVGGDPMTSELTSAAFHRLMASRAASSPHGLTATSTHDTKRGEDARARILALSELASDWQSAVEAWRVLNAGHSISAGHEYLIYQALIGAWPSAGVDADFVERMQRYAIKAAREGKIETSWSNPNETYEAALTAFVERILDPRRAPQFISSFEALCRRTALLGALNGLVQLTLKATMPGVPDFYQGSEFWDLSLVDPDNRRPVDFAARAQALAVAEDGRPDWHGLAERWSDGRIKLVLTRRLLALRNRMPALFRDGDYRPVEVNDRVRDRVIAFARSRGRRKLIVAVARHLASDSDGGRNWPVRSLGGSEPLFDPGELSSMRDALDTGIADDPAIAASAPFGSLPLAVWCDA